MGVSEAEVAELEPKSCKLLRLQRLITAVGAGMGYGLRSRMGVLERQALKLIIGHCNLIRWQ